MPENVDELLAAMEAEAQAERDAIVAEAEAKARDALQQAEAAAQELKAAELAKLERETRRNSERLIGEAQSCRRRATRGVKQEALALAFAQARERVAEQLQSGDCRDALPAILREVADAMGPDAQIQVAAQDVEVANRLAAELGLTQPVVAAGDEPGTVVAASPDGKRRVDNSIATRLGKAEAVLVQEVAAVLFRDPNA